MNDAAIPRRRLAEAGAVPRPLPLPGIAASVARRLLCLAVYLSIVPMAASAATLPRATPEQAGFSSEGLAKVDALIEASVADGFPGAVLAIVRDGKLVKLKAYGYARRYDEHGLVRDPPPMRVDTLFDLASNTKMYATTFALQRLVDEGKIDLDAPVQRYLPAFVDGPDDPLPGKAQVTVADLLRHSGGLAADVRYFDRAKAGPLFSQDRATTYARLMRTPLAYPPGSRNQYSDLGFMLLGRLVEQVAGMPLETYVERTFYAPLGLRHTLYAPLRGNRRLGRFSPSQCAATETRGNTRDGTLQFENVRTHTVQCEVHDEKAFYSLEQVGGHAGLFSTAEDVAVLQQVMLGGGRRGSRVFFGPETIARFTASAGPDPSYGLGWRLNRGDDPATFFGRYASPQAYGHTGWTGTVTLIDPARRLGIVLLTNKKNTPVVDPAKDANRFLGDTFPISNYRAVIERIYLAMRDRDDAAAPAP